MKPTAPSSPARRPNKRSASATAEGAKTGRSRPTGADSFSIVGIGASAGGLEALVQFFEHLPVDTGMAFVIIQHLDPTQKGMMPELLQRATRMKVLQVTDRTKVRPDRVYVIPPNRDLSLLHGVLHLLDPAAPRGLRLPIDFFFRSLAEDQQERAAAIILSGMGSDGTLGLGAIKEKNGLALVQDPASAKFDSMPRSAIAAGLADFVFPPRELAARLVAYRRSGLRLGPPGRPLEEKVQSALDKIVILLRSHGRNDFTLYRRSTLHRRVERRMGVHQLPRIEAYLRFLQENPQELGILFKELLIGVTQFFRDPGAWQQLARRGIPTLLADRPGGGALRAWVAGCSTGEEAYTLAIVFAEALKRQRAAGKFTLQIYATDLDRDAIDKARQGFYPDNIAADVSPARLARYFTKETRGYRVRKEIRAMVVFAPQNLIMDPPFTKLDILCCRNLLIYLTPELQKKLFPLFHYSLTPGGLLFLGSAESVGGFSSLFAPLAAKERLFVRRLSAGPEKQFDFPAVFLPVPSARVEATQEARLPAQSLQAVADRLLQTRFAPPAVLVNSHGDILYISGRTGAYLEPAAGKADWNVLGMAREGLRYHLGSALQQVQRTKGTVTVRDLRISSGPDGRCADLTVQALEDPPELRGLTLVVFTDSVAPAKPRAGGSRRLPAASARHRELERELQRAREELHADREEMQTAQEELRSMNEELQSTNEELQSTNEELMTSKEEMQSLNEELQTVNAELQSKLEELAGASDDMKNLLNSTDIATVFLDRELRVRRFTPQARSIIKFIPGDVGRPITDLASDLLYPALVADARTVLRTQRLTERAIATADGRWFTARVLPCRSTDNRADGVVLTFADITAARKLEAELRETHRDLARHAEVQGAALGRALGRLQDRPPRTQPARSGRGATASRTPAGRTRS